MIDSFADAAIDCLKLLPFLFITYLVMEWIEHHTGEKTRSFIQKSGQFGPVAGAVLGVFPQCGFSAAASGFYAGRIITLGTLIAVYLSTSDEMLPIFISESVGAGLIIRILLIKIVIAMVVGILIDLLYRCRKKESENIKINAICEHEHCHCESGIFKSALHHTLHITLFVFLVSLVLNLGIHFVGEDTLGRLLSDRAILGPVLSGIIGLIPNCAASVILTQLYLEGILSAGAMMAGLLVGGGIGILVLFRVNDKVKENIKIVLLLYVIGIICGILIDLLGIIPAAPKI